MFKLGTEQGNMQLHKVQEKLEDLAKEAKKFALDIDDDLEVTVVDEEPVTPADSSVNTSVVSGSGLGGDCFAVR